MWWHDGTFWKGKKQTEQVEHSPAVTDFLLEVSLY